MKLCTTSVITIILPEVATTREQFAAEELSKYLTAIFPDITINTRADDIQTDTGKILIGGPERNRHTSLYINEAEFDSLVPGPEGILIKSYSNDTLVLAGSSKNPSERERGTIYAVYEFLERYLGCCFGAFFNPDYPGGEYIPKRTMLALNDIEYIKNRADNLYRCATPQYDHGRRNDTLTLHKLNLPFYDWLAKNRYNIISLWQGVYEILNENGIVAEFERRGFQLLVGHHQILQAMLPPMGNAYFPEHYAQTHPEFFKLQEDGTRYRPDGFQGQWILCSRNEELADTMAQNILFWLEKNPAVDSITLVPQDGRAPQCVCPACSKYTKTENYIHFVNKVARRIRKVMPHITLFISAYVDLWDCPDGATLEPNVCVREAVWHSSGLCTVGKPDGSCLIGTFLEEDLLKWKRTGAKVSYSHYYMGVYPARQRYMPAADEMQSLHCRCKEVGIEGINTQIECYNFWNNVFNFYCLSRVGYDNSLSIQIQLEKFSAIFGEGAPYIKEIITLAEDTLDGQATIIKAGLYLMEHLDMDRVYELFEKALAAATTPTARNNIRMLRMALRYSELECQVTDMVDCTNYKQLETCADPTGELYYMSHAYDSRFWNNPGFGIMLPVDCEKQTDFIPDHWYSFEK